MRRVCVAGMVCLAVSLLVAASAEAQGQGQGGRRRGGFGGGGFGGGMFGGRMGAAMLLGMEQIQTELKLTEEQKQQVVDLRPEMQALFQGGFGRGQQDLSDEEREKAREERRKKSEELNKKAEAILDADQAKRLKQISLQMMRNGVFSDPEVSKALALTEDQSAQIKTIAEEIQRQTRELFQSAGEGDRQKAFADMQELEKNATDEYLAVLSEEQKAKLAELKGAKFEMDFSQFGRGGFGGPGGGRRRGGNNADN